LALSEAEARRLHSGQVLSLSRLAARETLGDISDGLVLRAMDGERLVALARIDNGEIRSVRVMNLQPNSIGEDDVDYA